VESTFSISILRCPGWPQQCNAALNYDRRVGDMTFRGKAAIVGIGEIPTRYPRLCVGCVCGAPRGYDGR
jgi:hypothetical protein